MDEWYNIEGSGVVTEVTVREKDFFEVHPNVRVTNHE